MNNVIYVICILIGQFGSEHIKHVTNTVQTRYKHVTNTLLTRKERVSNTYLIYVTNRLLTY